MGGVTMAKLTKAQKAEQAEAIQHLREMLPPGSKVYTKVDHVSRSGMQRHISLYVATVEDGKPIITPINWYVARALDYRRAKDGGLVVGGCGMDMCFHLVYCLGHALFPDGGDLELSPRKWQEKRDGKTKETDGGYLLKKVDL
jgi:hypothetical protein